MQRGMTTPRFFPASRFHWEERRKSSLQLTSQAVSNNEFLNKLPWKWRAWHQERERQKNLQADQKIFTTLFPTSKNPTEVGHRLTKANGQTTQFLHVKSAAHPLNKPSGDFDRERAGRDRCLLLKPLTSILHQPRHSFRPTRIPRNASGHDSRDTNPKLPSITFHGLINNQHGPANPGELERKIR